VREDPAGSRLTQPRRDPRVVVQLVYPTASIYITNRSGIANVPGTALHGCLTKCSSTSQRLQPLEGRTQFGSLEFTVTDVDGQLTDAIRDQLTDEDEGWRRREVRIFTGDTDDFTHATWRRVATYIIDGRVGLDASKYTFKCYDLNRELRKDVFDFKRTRLAVALGDADTTVVVTNASEFELVQHTATFTDAPLQLVGYLHLPKTGEIIRYTSKVDNGNGTWSFLGCVREVGNTIAVEVELEGVDSEQWPEVQEVIYLEMSVADHAYVIATGEDLAGTMTVPDHWHLGISTTLIEDASLENIGTDLHDPASADAGLILRLLHLSRVDGKKFLEEQVCRPAWMNWMVTPEGKLRFRRITSMLSTSSSIRVLNEGRDLIGLASINHDGDALVNEMVIRWNKTGDGLSRTTRLYNLASQQKHKISEAVELEFEGLTVNRHQTGAVIARIMDTYTDRLGSPPITFTQKLSRRHNDLEVGDVVRCVMPSVRDFAGQASFDRACEVQAISVNWLTGDTVGEFFATTSKYYANQPVPYPRPLPDTWYSSAGALVSSALTVVDNHVTANGTLTGNDDMRLGVFYHLGDLTIDASVTVNFTQNVQLRVRGNLHISGRLDGVGRGHAGVTDPNVVSSPFVVFTPWTLPTGGSTRSGGGIFYTHGGNFYSGNGSPALVGIAATPPLAIQVENGELLGLPSECRGTPGLYGGPIVSSDLVVRGLGGNGGDGGAGLLIIADSVTFGVSGEIDTSGGPGDTGTAGDVSHGGHLLRPGTGGGGAPGFCYALLALPTSAIPDFAGHVVADSGATALSGNTIGIIPPDPEPAAPWTGIEGVGATDHWEAFSHAQYIPIEQVLGEGADEVVPAPVIVSAESAAFGVALTFGGVPDGEFGLIQLFSSITNNIEDATRVANIKAPYYNHNFDGIQTRYYWARAVQGAVRSAWSSGPTDGVQATGGRHIEVVTWLDTFDPYLSQAGFEDNWEITGGSTPTITFPTNGVNGGRVLRVEGAMRAHFKRNLAYDPNVMWLVEARIRYITPQSGQDAITIGFLGVKPDGVTLIDRVGGTSEALPNRTLYSAYAAAMLPPGWNRVQAWFTGSFNSNSFTDQGTHHFSDGRARGLPTHIRAASDGTKAVFIRPAIQLGQPSGTTIVMEIDTLRIARVETLVPADPNVTETNFGSTLDPDYWCIGAISNGVFPTLVAGAGINGGNAAQFQALAGDGDGFFSELVHRQFIPIPDTLKVAITYRFVEITTITNTATLEVRLQGYKLDTAASALGLNSYIANTTGARPEATAAFSTLTQSGAWTTVTFTLTGVLANTNMADSDYARLVIDVDGEGSSDVWKLQIGRVKVVPS